MVYKLVELNHKPCIKLSQDMNKVTIPGAKQTYRLFSESGCPIVDLITLASEKPPQPKDKLLCRHPFDESKRALVNPSRVVRLLHLVWLGKDSLAFLQSSLKRADESAASASSSNRDAQLEEVADGVKHNMRTPFVPLNTVKQAVKAQLTLMREDHLRPLNPTPYKVSVSTKLYDFLHELWISSMPIAELY